MKWFSRSKNKTPKAPVVNKWLRKIDILDKGIIIYAMGDVEVCVPFTRIVNIFMDADGSCEVQYEGSYRKAGMGNNGVAEISKKDYDKLKNLLLSEKTVGENG